MVSKDYEKKFIIVEFLNDKKSYELQIVPFEIVQGMCKVGQEVICTMEDGKTKNAIFRGQYTTISLAEEALNNLQNQSQDSNEKSLNTLPFNLEIAQSSTSNQLETLKRPNSFSIKSEINDFNEKEQFECFPSTSGSTTDNLLSATMAHEFAILKNVKSQQNQLLVDLIKTEPQSSDFDQKINESKQLDYQNKKINENSCEIKKKIITENNNDKRENKQQEKNDLNGEPPALFNELRSDTNAEYNDYNDDEGPDELIMEGPSMPNDYDLTINSPPPSLKPIVYTEENKKKKSAEILSFLESDIIKDLNNETLINLKPENYLTFPYENLKSNLLDVVFEDLDLIKSALTTILENQLAIIKHVDLNSSLNDPQLQTETLLLKMKSKMLKRTISTIANETLNSELQKVNNTELKKENLNSLTKTVKGKRISFAPLSVNEITDIKNDSNENSGLFSNSNLYQPTRVTGTLNLDLLNKIKTSSNKNNEKIFSQTLNWYTPETTKLLKQTGTVLTPSSVSGTSNLHNNIITDLSKSSNLKRKNLTSSKLFGSEKITEFSTPLATATAVTSTSILQFKNGVPVLNDKPVLLKNLDFQLSKNTQESPPLLLAQYNKLNTHKEQTTNSKRSKIVYDDLPPLQREIL